MHDWWQIRKDTFIAWLKITPAISYSNLDPDRGICSCSELLINFRAIKDMRSNKCASCERHPFHYSLARSLALHLHTADWHFSWSSSREDSKCSLPWRWTNRRDTSRHENANCVSPPPQTTRALGHYFMVIGWVLKCGAYLRSGFSVSLAVLTPGSSLYPSYNRPALTWNIKKYDDIRHSRAIESIERLFHEKYRSTLYGEVAALPNRL